MKTLADSISLHCYRYTDWQQGCPSMQKIKPPATSPTLFQDVSKAMRPSENWLWYSAEVSCKSTCCHFLAKSSHGIGGHMTPIQDMAVHFLWGKNTTHAINEALQHWTKRIHQDTCTGVKWKNRFYHWSTLSCYPAVLRWLQCLVLQKMVGQLEKKCNKNNTVVTKAHGLSLQIAGFFFFASMAVDVHS